MEHTFKNQKEKIDKAQIESGLNEKEETSFPYSNKGNTFNQNDKSYRNNDNSTLCFSEKSENENNFPNDNGANGNAQSENGFTGNGYDLHASCGNVIESQVAEKKKSTFSEKAKKYFSPLRIAYLALFLALSYVMYLPTFEFSLIPAVPFLKIDFSNTFVLIAGFSLGPIAGVVVGVLKEILHALTFSQTVGIGEIANILLILPYVLIPSIIYKKHKGIKPVILSLIIACLSVTVWSFPVNYTITFPFYLKLFANMSWTKGMHEYINNYWYWAVLFNLVKTILISVAVFILYKPLSRLIKLTNKKFNKKK